MVDSKKNKAGATKLGIGSDDNHVLMVFTTEGDYVALLPKEARAVAYSLIDKAEVVDVKAAGKVVELVKPGPTAYPDRTLITRLRRKFLEFTFLSLTRSEAVDLINHQNELIQDLDKRVQSKSDQVDRLREKLREFEQPHGKGAG